jgi:hypothetical protein
MSIGFIPSNDNDVQERTAVTTGSDDWLTSHVYQRLFSAVQNYCLQLATIDPGYYSAELEEAEVVLRLGCIETLHERLEILTAEARRLRCAVAEAQRRSADTKRPNRFRRRIAQLRSNFMSGGVRDPAVWALGCLYAWTPVLVLLYFFGVISNNTLGTVFLAKYALLGAGGAIALVYFCVAWIKETPRAERGRCYRALLIVALVLIGVVVGFEAVVKVCDWIELHYGVPPLLSMGVCFVVSYAVLSVCEPKVRPRAIAKQFADALTLSDLLWGVAFIAFMIYCAVPASWLPKWLMPY